jgi:antitoxin CptB
MSPDHDPLDTTRKRLLWRASRRGIKEMDLLVGGFAARELPHMTATELRIFESLLEIPDQQLLSFVTEQEAVPASLDCKMLRALLAFRPELKDA